jgi:hypothetical protein
MLTVPTVPIVPDIRTVVTEFSATVATLDQQMDVLTGLTVPKILMGHDCDDRAVHDREDRVNHYSSSLLESSTTVPAVMTVLTRPTVPPELIST